MYTRVQKERELIKPLRAGILARVLAFGDFFCLQAFGPLHQFELDFLPLVQTAIAVTLNRAEVNKNIVRPVGHRDKAESLGIVEPLHCSRLAV